MTGELSLFLVSSDYSVWSPWFNHTDKNSLECVVELQRTGCYSRWDHHMQAISSLSLHITFLPPQPPLPTPIILPTPTPTHHKATRPEMTATVHEHTKPLQDHSHMWSHKHWATSPLITWQPYSADSWGTMTDSNNEQPTTMLHNQWWQHVQYTNITKDQMNPSWSMASGDGSIGAWVSD